MNWQDCKINGLVKPARANAGRIRSLQIMSAEKISSADFLPLYDFTISSKIALTYDGLRELLEALSLQDGFKVYNHECYTSFLNEIRRVPKIAKSFDNFRVLRNSINYEGKRINIGEGTLILEKMKYIINQVKNLIKD